MRNLKLYYYPRELRDLLICINFKRRHILKGLVHVIATDVRAVWKILRSYRCTHKKGVVRMGPGEWRS
jgi:hypothetical protein